MSEVMIIPFPPSDAQRLLKMPSGMSIMSTHSHIVLHYQPTDPSGFVPITKLFFRAAPLF